MKIRRCLTSTWTRMLFTAAVGFLGTTGIFASPLDTLSGPWTERDGGAQLLFDDTRVVERAGDRLKVSGLLSYEKDRLVVRYQGKQELWKVQLTDGVLRIERPDGVQELVRLKEVPVALKLEPLDLPESRPLTPEQVATLAAELSWRMELDQEVRKAGPAAFEDPVLRAKALEVDAENERFLLATVRDVGWFDATRFGAKAASAALTMAKHHENLPLLMAILPAVERDFKGSPELYSIFVDGLRIELGEAQLFGSQIGEDSNGSPCVLDLASPQAVNQRREELGLSPLSEYLDLISQFSGKPVKMSCN